MLNENRYHKTAGKTLAEGTIVARDRKSWENRCVVYGFQPSAIKVVKQRWWWRKQVIYYVTLILEQTFSFAKTCCEWNYKVISDKCLVTLATVVRVSSADLLYWCIEVNKLLKHCIAIKARMQVARSVYVQDQLLSQNVTQVSLSLFTFKFIEFIYLLNVIVKTLWLVISIGVNDGGMEIPPIF